MELCEYVHANMLRERCVTYTLTHLHTVSKSRWFQVTSQRNSRVMGYLYSRIRRRNESMYGVRFAHIFQLQTSNCCSLVQALTANDLLEPKDEKFSAKFPWKSAVVLVIAMAMYYTLQQFTSTTSYVIPVINFLALIAALVVGVRGLLM